MNLSESLSELKMLRTRISRLIEFREKTLKHKKEEKIEKTFIQLTEEIQKLATESSILKYKIFKANVTTEAEKGKNIQELIFQQGDIRSEISALKSILGHGKRRYESGVFDNSYDKDDTVFQISRFQVEDKIRELEKQKRILDSKIQQANWRTKIE